MLNCANSHQRLKPLPRARTAGIIVGLALLLSMPGCAGFLGERATEERSDGVLLQKGSVKVPGQQEVDVYYPVGYASHPNLETDNDFFQCVIVEQKADHFRVKNSQLLEQRVTWTARGLTVQPASSTPSASSPATELVPGGRENTSPTKPGR